MTEAKRTREHWVRRAGMIATWMMAGCAADGVDGAHIPSDQTRQQTDELRLSDAARCEAGRLESTVVGACRQTGALPRLQAAPLDADRLPTLPLWLDLAFGVVLPTTTEGAAGALEFEAPQDGNYLVYLGTPNANLTLRSVTEQTPLCSAYLPLVAPEGYTPGCHMRGAYEFALKQGRHRLELRTPADSSASYVRVYVARRRTAGATLIPPICSAGFDTTLSAACQQAADTLPINAARPAGAPVMIERGTAYGVHLRPAGDLHEGELTFVPPFTGDYVVYTGTPNIGVAVSTDTDQAMVDCASAIPSSASCPALKAGFRLERLVGGVAHRIELGPTTPSWVRVLVEAEHPDADGDGIADNYDECFGPDDTDFCCADASCTQATFLGDHAISDETNGLFQASGILEQADGSFAMAGTAAVERDLGYGPGDEPQGSVVTLSPAFEVVSPVYVDSPVGYSGYVGWGAEVARDPVGNYLLRSRLGGTEDSDFRSNLTKLSPAGAVLWTTSQQLGYNAGRAAAMAVDAVGDVIHAGTYTSESQDDSYFVTKLASGGQRLFSRAGTGTLRDVAVDAAGAIFTIGEVFGASGRSVVVSKLSATGELLRTTSHAGSVGTSLAVLGDGKLALAGLDAGGAAWLSLLDADGTELWRQTYSAAQQLTEALVAVGPSGQLALAAGGFEAPASLYAVATDGRPLWRYRRTVASRPTGLSYGPTGVLSVSLHDAPRDPTPTTRVLQFGPL